MIDSLKLRSCPAVCECAGLGRWWCRDPSGCAGEPAGNPQTTAQTGHPTTAYHEDDDDDDDDYDDDDYRVKTRHENKNGDQGF